MIRSYYINKCIFTTKILTTLNKSTSLYREIKFIIKIYNEFTEQ